MHQLAADVTAFLVKAAVLGTLYVSYRLIDQYSTAVMGGIFLSIVMHPSNRVAGKNAELQCAETLKTVSERWSNSKRSVKYWAGVLVSVGYFVEWLLWEASFAMGVDKFPVLGKRPFLRNAAFVLCAGAFGVSLGNAHVLLTVGAALLVLLVVLVLLPMTYQTYVARVKRIVMWVVGISFCIGIVFAAASDISELSTAVTAGGKTGMEQVHSGISWLATKIIPKDVSEGATQFVREVRPVLTNFSLSNTSHWSSHGRTVYERFTELTSNHSAWKVLGNAVSKYTLAAGNSAFGVIAASTRTLLSTVVDVFGLMYEVFLFGSIYYALKARKRSALFYLLQKVTRINNIGQPSEKIDRMARERENDIVAPLRQLLMSYWHLAWFYFLGTYALFEILDLSFGVLASFASLFIALFPFVPPLLPSLLFPMVGLILKGEWAKVGFVVLSIYSMDRASPYLVRVSHRPIKSLHHHPHRRPRGQSGKGKRPEPIALPHNTGAPSSQATESHQQQPIAVNTVTPVMASPMTSGDEWYDFVIKTAVILGLMSFGLRGVIIGPAVAIVVKQMWGWVGEDEASNVLLGLQSPLCPPTTRSAAKVGARGCVSPPAQPLFASARGDSAVWSLDEEKGEPQRADSPPPSKGSHLKLK